MGCEVYANSNEIACKAGGGKVIAAFPDVCLSPPSPPAGPIPIPYPDTSFSKDMKNGSKTVKIKGKEIMLKDKSFYKTSPLGDEAATKGLGQGVVSHTITGKTYFKMWSMDVKTEGENVDRHVDITTSNHMGQLPPNEGVPMANIAMIAPPPSKDKCKCCGKDMHSQAQENGDYMTEQEFYDTASNPATKKKLDDIRANPDCQDILPDLSDAECNKYYKTTPRETKKISKKWDRHKKRHSMSGRYAHKVPKSAGGCPTGKNVAPLKPQCEKLEVELSKIQDQRLLALGWR